MDIFKILIIGDSGVGKTNIMERFTKNEFNENTKSTIGVDFSTKVMQVANKKIKIQIWDTAGQEKYSILTSSYYRGAKGCIIVYDITDMKSFESVEKWLSEIKQIGEQIEIILVGNKSDETEKRVVQYRQAQELAHKNELTFIETSAFTSSNVEDCFNSLVELIVQKQGLDERERNISSTLLDFQEEKKPKKNCGC
eukprot:TRINITY_DN732_c0_g1_i1.p1 TRINITY_DN732_c0_g1~~TRINITY_DN732_c0_g1_i1.p1  ORF type:complete len:196 (-),score=52.34 TRINITY_DN732_c0_g1_i1:52-639(-)